MTVDLSRATHVKLIFRMQGNLNFAFEFATEPRPLMERGRDSLFLFHCDSRDLYAGIIDQGRCLDGRAGGLGIGHNAFVNLVHVRELMNIGEINRHADDVLQFETRCLKYLLNIFECGGRFGADATGNQCVGSVATLRPCDVERVAGHDAITERKTSCGG